MLTTKGHKKERKFKCGTTIVRAQKKNKRTTDFSIVLLLLNSYI